MITKKEALKKVKNYLDQRGTIYSSVDETVRLERDEPVPFGKYLGQKKDLYSVKYYEKSPHEDFLTIIVLDAQTGELLFGGNSIRFFNI